MEALVINLKELVTNISSSVSNGSHFSWVVAIIRSEIHHDTNISTIAGVHGLDQSTVKRNGQVLQWHIIDDSECPIKFIFKSFGKFSEEKLRHQLHVGSIVLLRRCRKIFSRSSIKNDGDENHALTQLVITGDVVAQFYDDTWFALSPSHDPAAMQSIQSSNKANH